MKRHSISVPFIVAAILSVALIAPARAASNAHAPSDARGFAALISSSDYEVRFLEKELEAFVMAAGASSKPSPVTLDYEGERYSGNIESKRFESKSIEVAKDLDIGSKRSHLKRKAAAEVEAMKLSTRKSVQSILYGAAAGLLNCIKTRYLRSLSGENAAVAWSLVSASEQRYEVFLASRMEVEQAGLDYETQLLKGIDAEAEYRGSLDSLMIVHNLSSNDAFLSLVDAAGSRSLTGEIAALAPALDIEIPDGNRLFEIARARRPDYLALSYEEKARRAELGSARAEGTPSLTIGLFRGISDLNETERGVRFRLSMPLTDFGRRKLETGSLSLKLAGFDPASGAAAVRNFEETVLSEIFAARNRCEALRAKFRKLSGSVLKRSSAVLEMAMAGYAEGATTLMELQAAKRSHFEHYEELVSAAFDYTAALLELRRACGFAFEENDDILGPAFFRDGIR